MNHNSFVYDLADGTPSDWLLTDDLRATISKEDAINAIAEFSAHFMDFCQR